MLRQLLALALCISLYGSAGASQIGRAAAASKPGISVPAAQLTQSGPSVLRFVELGFPEGARELPGAATATERAALSLVLEGALAGPEATRRLLVRADFPPSAIERVLEAAAGVKARLDSDPAALKNARELAAGLAKRAEKERDPKKIGTLGELLSRIVNPFGKAKDERAAVPAGPGAASPLRANLLPARDFARTPDGKDAKPAVALIPSSKRVSDLIELSKAEPAKAHAAAAAILADKNERRAEVRLSALRLLGSAPAETGLPLMIDSLKSEFNWYLRREAAKTIAERAAEIGESRAAAEEALKAAWKSSNGSLRLMAGRALRALGVDPGAEPFVDDDTAPKSKPAAEFKVHKSAPQPANPNPWIRRVLLAVLLVWIGLAVFKPLLSPAPPPKAPTAVEQVDKTKQVEAPKPATPEQVQQQIAENTARTAKAMERQADSFEKLAKGGESNPTSTILNLAFWAALIFGGFWLVRKFMGGMGPGGVAGQMKQVKNRMERPTTKFSDVAGIDDAQVEIQELADYLSSPGRYRRLGARVPKGVLLEGPPGTGKTLLARALAGESDAAFFSVSGSDFVEMFVGVGASRVRELFRLAKENAPAIVFIDEIDAIGKARGAAGEKFGGNDEREQTINAILSEMGGFEEDTGVIVVAATNRMDVLDPALLRPGRFDRKIHVGLPDVLGREAILGIHSLRARLAPEADLQFIAKRTPGLSGAFLENIINEGGLLAGRRRLDAIGPDELNESVDRETVGQKRNLFIPAELKRRIAIHESGHVIAGYLAGGKLPNKVTVVPHGGKALGFAEQGGEDDNFLYTQPELEARLVGILGSIAAERLIFGNSSTGPGNDLEQANHIARLMIGKLGMDEKIGMLIDGPDKSSPLGSRQVSELTAREIDLAVRELLENRYKRAAEILAQRRATLEAMAAALIERETLDSREISRIVGPVAKP